MVLAPATTQQVTCKAADNNAGTVRCRFDFTKLPYRPGLLLPAVQGGQPAAAAVYDPAQARLGSRPVPQCVRLSQENSLKPLDGAQDAKLRTTGDDVLDTAPFCGMQRVLNTTFAFEGLECGKQYAFSSRAAATPVAPGADPVVAELGFNITC